jgi:hypothetical protein
MNWDDYEIYHPGVVGPLHTLPRAEARRAYDRVMAEKPARIEMLRRLLKANGIELSSTDDGIQELNDWFIANLEADPVNPGRLLPEWYSVVNDVALFLGDVILGRCPGLRWEFYTGGKRNVAYQRHVIMGFSRVRNPKLNVDIDRNVATYAHRIVASRGSVPTYGKQTVRDVKIDVDAVAASDRNREVEDDAFWRWVKTAESKA